MADPSTVSEADVNALICAMRALEREQPALARRLHGLATRIEGALAPQEPRPLDVVDPYEGIDLAILEEEGPAHWVEVSDDSITLTGADAATFFAVLSRDDIRIGIEQSPGDMQCQRLRAKDARPIQTAMPPLAWVREVLRPACLETNYLIDQVLEENGHPRDVGAYAVKLPEIVDDVLRRCEKRGAASVTISIPEAWDRRRPRTAKIG